MSKYFEGFTRSHYYNGRGLSIEQIRVAEELSDSAFANWIQIGLPIATLNIEIESKRLNDARGQHDPSQTSVKLKGKVTEAELGDGNIGEFGLQLRPNREPNSYDIEAANDAYQAFLARYQQVLPSAANHAVIHKFLSSRGAKCTAKNYQIAFENLWGNLTLHTIEKVIEEPTTKLNSRGKPVRIDPFFFPKPVKAELVEVVMSPQDVRNLSSKQMEVFMRPMSFAGVAVTSSANDYARSEEFLSENPPQAASTQTEAQILREAKIFLVSHPQYDRFFGDMENFGDLYKLILGKINEWGLQISESSFADAFRWAEAEGIIPKVDTTVHAQVVTSKATPDARRHWSQSDIAKEIRNMSSTEFQEKINSDPAFRARVDSSR